MNKKALFILVVLFFMLTSSCINKTNGKNVADDVDTTTRTDVCEYLVKDDQGNGIALLQQIVEWNQNTELDLIKVYSVIWNCDLIATNHDCRLVKSYFDIYPTVWMEKYSVWGLYEVDDGLFVKKITATMSGDRNIECKVSQ